MATKSDSYYADAFETCYVNNFHKIRSFIYGYLADNEQSQSIAQEVFITLWENREKVNFEESLLPYLFLIAKNKSLNFMQKAESARRYVAYAGTHTRETLDLMALSHNSSASIYSKEIGQLAEKAMEAMPPTVKETFLLSRNENLKYSELAAELGVSVKTIEYRISSALRILRTYLKDYLPFYIGYLLHILFNR